MYTETVDFDQQDFIHSIKVEMKYQGLKVHELGTATFIGQSRIRGLLNSTCKFTKTEVKEIKKFLGMD
jgi:gamma-glutamylcysteine synthetase